MQEKVDEGADEVKSATYDGVRELEECSRRCITKSRLRYIRYSELMDEERTSFMETVEDESEKFLRLAKSYRSLVEQQQETAQMTDTTVKKRFGSV